MIFAVYHATSFLLWELHTMTSELSLIPDDLVAQIRSFVADTRNRVAQQINHEAVVMNWHIGKMVVDFERSHIMSDESARGFILQLSRALSREIGRGFSRSNLFHMRKFYLCYPSVQTVSGQLSWSHYCELCYVADANARSFYEKESANSRWNVRTLRRQIETSLFERLLLSEGNANKEKVLELAREGVTYQAASDILKDPYVFEFLGVPDDKPILERELERALIERIEDFLLELGRGFMFVGSQQRVTLGNVHHYVDLVFYNKILRAYVLIDLKTGKFVAENVGQMNMYLNYYATEINDEGDNPPIGIVLTTKKDELAAEYALGGLTTQIFASKYTYYIPDKQQLVNQVEAVIQRLESEQ